MKIPKRFYGFLLSNELAYWREEKMYAVLEREIELAEKPLVRVLAFSPTLFRATEIIEALKRSNKELDITGIRYSILRVKREGK